LLEPIKTIQKTLHSFIRARPTKQIYQTIGPSYSTQSNNQEDLVANLPTGADLNEVKHFVEVERISLASKG